MAGEQSTLLHLFGELARLRKAWSALASNGEVSSAQFSTMMHIAYGERPWMNAHCPQPRNCGVTLSELAQMERYSLPAASKRISQLEEAGLVRREAAPEDRRVSRVYLTDDGIALLVRARNNVGRQVALAFDRLGTEKVDTLIRLTGELAEILEQINK